MTTLPSHISATPSRIDESIVNVVDIGTGPPIVFLHGWQGSWHNWIYQLSELSTDYRVVAIDLPGLGGSGPLLPPITLPRYAEFVLKVCDHLDITSATFVGNSMGGFVATEIALIAPHRVHALGLVAAAGMSHRYLLPKPFLRRRGGTLLSRLLFDPEIGPRIARIQHIALRLAAGLVGAITFHEPRRLDPELKMQMIENLGRPGAHGAGQACINHENRHLLNQITCPTLILWGSRDRLLPVRDSYDYAEAIPHSQLMIYPKVGHCPQIERPHRFNRDLSNFLRRVTSERQG